MDTGGEDKDSVVMMEENKDQDTLGETPNPRDRDKTLDKNHRKPQKNYKINKIQKNKLTNYFSQVQVQQGGEGEHQELSFNQV